MKVDFTVAPDETGDESNTDDAFKNLETFMESGKPMRVNGKELPTMGETLEAEKVTVEQEEDGGLRDSTKIVLGVVFGLIGVAIIIAIIVICVR